MGIGYSNLAAIRLHAGFLAGVLGALLVSGVADAEPTGAPAQGFSQGAWAQTRTAPIADASEGYGREDALQPSHRIELGKPDEAMSVLVNYGMSRIATPADDSATTLDLDTQVRYRGWLIQSQSAHRFGATEHEQIRLGTLAAYDIPSIKQRLTLGDQNALSGDLGAPARVFGVGFGQASSAQSGEVYTASERVFFFDSGLGSGEHEYSYRVGRLRQGFGQESNHYGDPVFIGQHRVGLQGGRAIGLSLDATTRGWSGGSGLRASLGSFGTLSATFATSKYDANEGVARKGYAAAVSHRYQAQAFSARGFFRSQSEDFRNPLVEATSDQRKWLAGVETGFATKSLGSFSALASKSTYYTGNTGSQEIGFNYSRTLSPRARLSASLSRTSGAADAYSGLIGFSYLFDAAPRAPAF